MKKIVWTNDIHLNFVNIRDIKKFCSSINSTHPDAVFICGDIAEAINLQKYLILLEKLILSPIYFVLGNHDYYNGSIIEVRENIRVLVKQSSILNWMPYNGLIELTEKTCLIGHGSWSDGRFGDYFNSKVFLNDYLLIKDFKGLNKTERFHKLIELGDQAADFLKMMLLEAIGKYKNIILITHVPPFKEACLYRGEVSDDNYLPHFSCKSVGEVLSEIMITNPHHTLTVLCGHTHGGGEIQILPNLLVKIGAAEYSKPTIQEVFTVE